MWFLEYVCFDGVVGYHVRLTRERSRVRFSLEIYLLIFFGSICSTCTKGLGLTSYSTCFVYSYGREFLYVCTVSTFWFKYVL